MPSFGFIGPTYTSQSITADGERCVNAYLEKIESGHGKSPGAQGFYLVGTPGLKIFTTLPTLGCRGLMAQGGRLFAVYGSRYYEIKQDKSHTRGTAKDDVGPGDRPVGMFPNGTQVFLVSEKNGYLDDGIVVQGPVVAAVAGAYIDGYFLAQQPDSNFVQYSNLEDGLTWPPLQNFEKSGGPDRLFMTIADHEQVFLFGEQSIEVFYDTGQLDQTFQRIPGAYIEQGIYAPFSVVKLDNSLFWLGGDSRGIGVVWRLQGYSPVRVSNHAVELAIQNLANPFDAIAYAYQDKGHSFYVLNFPTGDQTWVYDVSSGQWHERASWDVKKGQYHADLGWYHAYVWGRHFVGDHQSGNLYEMSQAFYDLAGEPRRWLRSAPHISNEMKRMKHNYLLLDMEVGIAPQGLNPQVGMQVSNDGGHSWGNEKILNLNNYGHTGAAGEYKYRCKWDRLGIARDRCYRVYGSDPIPVALIDAYLDVTPGTGF
jgi:hypothetical protein